MTKKSSVTVKDLIVQLKNADYKVEKEMKPKREKFKKNINTDKIHKDIEKEIFEALL